jgi:hypothetical protein
VFSYKLEGNEKYFAAQLYEKDESGRYIVEVDEHVAKVAQTLDGELFASQVPITMVSRVGITTEYRDVYINL